MRGLLRFILGVAVGVGLQVAVTSMALAAPASKLIDKHWTQAGAMTGIDHSAWDGFLKRHVKAGGNGVNLVAYGKVSAAAKAALDGYIKALEATPVSTYSKAEQFAFWVNMYNAVTVKLVLDAYPVKSIKSVKGGFFNSGPWDEEVVTVEGRKLSLNDIEHGILRPVWKDPRIHYVVNCASIGCPNLAPVAFTPANTEKLLDQSARDYINHPRGAKVAGGRLTVSSIFEWYQADFGGNDAGVIAHLKKYASGDLKAGLEGVSSVHDDDYDWNLNGG